MQIAFLGLGVMGNPICANLLAGVSDAIRVYDIKPARMENLLAQGAQPAASAPEAVAGCDLVLTSLPGPEQIEQAAFGEPGFLAVLKPGATWIDLSTNDLVVYAKIDAYCRDHGIGFLDCPVSGGDEGARAATLTLLAGGTPALFKQWQPVLRTIGENIYHVGCGGAGYSAKIAQVTLCYLHSLALSEALMLGIRGGVTPQQMLKIIRTSTGTSYVADRYGPSLLNGDYDPSFTIGLAHKDMQLASDMARNLDLTLPMCDLTTATYARAIEAYGFNANHLKAVRLLEEANQTFLRAAPLTEPQPEVMQ